MLIERSIRDARCDEDGLGIRGASDELLRGLLTAAVLAVEKRFAPSTRGQDRSYWRMWVAWCDLIGTPPLRTNSAANEGRVEHLHRREVALALGAFMTWVTEAEQRGYKIESMKAAARPSPASEPWTAAGAARLRSHLSFALSARSSGPAGSHGALADKPCGPADAASRRR